MANNHFRYGVEVELLLSLRKPPRHPFLNLKTFAEYLVEVYKSAGHPKMIENISGYEEKRNDYLKWSVTNDVTLKKTSSNQCTQSLLLA